MHGATALSGVMHAPGRPQTCPRHSTQATRTLSFSRTLSHPRLRARTLQPCLMARSRRLQHIEPRTVAPMGPGTQRYAPRATPPRIHPLLPARPCHPGQIGSFREVASLVRMPHLKDLCFSDPHWGDSPVAVLSNYQTYALFCLPSLTALDTQTISPQTRQVGTDAAQRCMPAARTALGQRLCSKHPAAPCTSGSGIGPGTCLQCPPRASLQSAQQWQLLGLAPSVPLPQGTGRSSGSHRAGAALTLELPLLHPCWSSGVPSSANAPFPGFRQVTAPPGHAPPCPVPCGVGTAVLVALTAHRAPPCSHQVAEATFLKKRMYYNMRLKTLRRNLGRLTKLAREGLESCSQGLRNQATRLEEAIRGLQRIALEAAAGIGVASAGRSRQGGRSAQGGRQGGSWNRDQSPGVWHGVAGVHAQWHGCERDWPWRG